MEIAKEITPEQAKEVLEKEVQKRVADCSERINAALKEYDCRLDTSITVSSQGNFPIVRVVPNEPKPVESKPAEVKADWLGVR